MSEMDSSRLRYEVLIQQDVDAQLNRLIEDGRQLADDFFNGAGKSSELTATQMSKLLDVCGDTDSVEVVIGYIQYQIGRDDKHKNWSAGGFGEDLIKKLRAHKKTAEAVVNTASKASDCTLPEAGKPEVDHVWMLLVRQYIGHLRRYFTYKR